ncbi:MAG: helicase-exonuclease AddAB subunit AddA [Oscillospiraceae bacterium]
MSNKWTPEQQQAIDAKNSAIIVSAAAGSGKTSVLVERLAKQISSTEEKIPADRIIVVTFTNDAAAEMKQRLTKRLTEMIEKEPENLWLSEQQILLQSAKIMTINSFCFDLIRENIHAVDVASGFRILDESEEKIILTNALDSVLNDYYCNKKDAMNTLYDFFCRKNDEPFVDVIFDLHKFAVAVPFFEDWLAAAASNFELDLDIEKNIFVKKYRHFLAQNFLKLKNDATLVKASVSAFGAPAAEALVDEEIGYFEKLSNDFSSKKIKFQQDFTPLKNAKFGRISFPKTEKNSPEEAQKETIMQARDDYKKRYKKLVENSLFSEEEMRADFQKQIEILSYLADFLTAFHTEIWRQKVEKNALGFSDGEMLAVGLLSKKNADKTIEKSQLAEEISQYNKVIMIDEFQDSNDVQALIFRLLSRNGTAEKGGENLFLVGDVKQSIYGFRLANPSIFMETLTSADLYSDDYKGKNAAILLSKNFRSSSDVVDFVNFIFENIMSKEVGDIDYTNAEKLVCGTNFSTEIDRKTEVTLIEKIEPIEGSDEETAYANIEAKCVAEKIRKMLDEGHLVTDHNCLRPCKKSDFCILMRTKTNAKIFDAALANEGIDAVVDDTEAYLKSREISILLNLLKIIDNPLLDIPMVSVLMSPMFKITTEEIAKIRLYSPENNGNKPISFYVRVCCVLGKISCGFFDFETEKESFFPKLKEFDEKLEKLRYLSSSYSLDKLIRAIYDSTDFLSVVQIYKNGEQKKANLRLLLKYAESYENAINGGLSGFNRYINSLTSQNSDLKRAGTTGSVLEKVSIKTIHKSKGLEFPFVFLCGTCGEFNKRDFSKQMLINLSNGIGFKIQEKKELKYYETASHILINERKKSEAKSEEMRLLYVALTRAKEKLFITINYEEKYISKLKKFANNIAVNGGITPILVDKADRMQDWILMCLLQNKDCGILRKDAEVDFQPTDFSTNIDLHFYENIEKIDAEIQELTSKAFPSEFYINMLKNQIDFQYDYTNSKIPAKLTVSEISKSENEITLRRPNFLNVSGELTAAEKGTATHKFMQYANYERAAKSVENEGKFLVEKGYLSDAENDAVEITKVKKFFSSKLYNRISACENVFRERKFLVKIADLGDEFDFGYDYKFTDGMLQGIADCVFEEPDGVVIVDYKTDYVRSEKELVERYSPQLLLYKKAFGLLYKKPVKQQIIYSFCLGKEIIL